MNTSNDMTSSATDAPAGAATGYLVLEPNGGERLRFLGASAMRLKLDEATNGAVAFYEYISELGVT